MYLTLKRVEKCLFVLLLVCKFLNFTGVFTNKTIKIYKACAQFLCEISLLISVEYILLISISLAFEEN